MVTTTKIVYFRPDKRYVDNDALGSKYSCVIQDEFTSAENNICVPSYLTVFQHHTPKSRGGNVGYDKNSNNNRLLEKLCFYLIGSRQSPQLSDPLTNISAQNIDRIEFKGHIGFEEPVFDIIRQLPQLRKISFSLSLCKQGNFGTSRSQRNLTDESCPIFNHFVTNLKIVMIKCDKEKSCNCNQSDYESDQLDAREEALRLMIIRILERSVAQCPNIKRITMDVANWEGIRESIENAIANLKELKPSNITISKSHILVDKSSEIFHTTQPEVEAINDSMSGPTLIINSDQPQCSVEIDKSEINANGTPGTVDSTCEISIDDHELPDENQENMKLTDDNLGQEEPGSAEPSTCLVDMSKLLGSMLGIPTSSKSLTQQQPSLPLINTPLSTCTNKSNIINASDSETNQQSSPSINDQSSLATTPTSLAPSTKGSDCNTFSEESSQNEKKQENGTLSSEIITYAAAAASAPAVSSISNNNHKNHTRGNGNDSHRLYRANEGSRRTFSRDVAVGSGAATSKSSAEVAFSRNHPKKPYIPHVADLGKPVFTRAPLTNRHIQQK